MGKVARKLLRVKKLLLFVCELRTGGEIKVREEEERTVAHRGR